MDTSQGASSSAQSGSHESSTQYTYSEPKHATAFRSDKDVVYWLDNIDHKINTEVQQILTGYARVPLPDVKKHVYRIRERAWNIRSYPCTGIGLFLQPRVQLNEGYKDMLDNLRGHDARFIDVGCFVGQDLRRLVMDGIQSEKLIGMDIVDHWEVGFEMFNDRDRLRARYVNGNILLPPEELKKQADVIWVTCVLHQFNHATQIEACKRLVEMSRPGCIIAGMQAGSENPREKWQSSIVGGLKGPDYSYFLHDGNSWKSLWELVSKDTHTEWDCQARLRSWESVGYDPKDVAYLGGDVQIIEFTMRRKL